MISWNPVDSSKPSEGKIVIVAEAGGGTWYGYYNQKTDSWADDNFCCDMKVTHWMEFPEPPTTEDI